MTDTILRTLDEVREKRGLEPINPFMIEGLPNPQTQTETSPIPVNLEDVIELPQPADEPTRPAASLVVMDSFASLGSDGVVLVESETRAITAVIIKAMRRILRDKLRALNPAMPKQRRRRSEPVSETIVLTKRPDAPKKKRGRPRKNPVDASAPAV